MTKTKIEWASYTWNPISGCTKISEGCQNCYSERIAKRLAGKYGYQTDNPFKVTMHSNRLNEPMKLRNSRMIFVCSMGDLFHPDVPMSEILKVFEIMYRCQQHIFQVLTKRPERALEFYRQEGWAENVWAGVTAENQQRADERIPVLAQIPAAVRFISCEPLLGPINLNLCHECQGAPNRCYEHNKIDWIIAGGETGPGARQMHPDWAYSLRDQSVSAKIPFFFKSWGTYGGKNSSRKLDGRIWEEMPR